MPARVGSPFTGNATGNSGAISFTISPTVLAGQSMVLTVHVPLNTHTVSTVVQTNCTWIKITSISAVGDGTTEIWYCTAAGASPGATVTVTMNLSGQAGGVIGVYDTALSATVDKTATSSGTSGSPATGTTATTTSPVELWVGGMSSPDPTNVGLGYAPITNGFTLTEGDFANIFLGATHYGYVEKIVSSTGTAGTASTLGGMNWTGVIAAIPFVSATKFLSLLGCGT